MLAWPIGTSAMSSAKEGGAVEGELGQLGLAGDDDLSGGKVQSMLKIDGRWVCTYHTTIYLKSEM